MFRAPRKRQKGSTNRVRIVADDDAEGDDNESSQDDNATGSLLRARRNADSKSKVKKRTVVARSFDDAPDDCNDELLDRNSSKRRRRKQDRGLGFGGGGGGSGGGFSTDAIADAGESKRVDDSDERGASTYDLRALSKLRAEQEVYTRPPLVHDDNDRRDETTRSQTAAAAAAAAVLVAHVFPRDVRPDFLMPGIEPAPSPGAEIQAEDFISFSDGKHRAPRMDESSILTGDEALTFIQQLEQEKDGSTGSTTNTRHMDEDVEDEHQRRRAFDRQQDKDEAVDDSWEVEVTRRAGVLPSKGDPTIEAQMLSNDMDPLAAASKSTDILDQLTIQINLTLDQLKSQDADVEQRIKRRLGEIETNAESVKRHEAEHREARSAFEFYQMWRNKLIPWVGALRELQTKVDSILSAIHELETDKAAVQRWMDWENDIITVLQEHGYVEQVVGRQPPKLAAASTLPEARVDEFGRDIKSQHIIQREKRGNHRRRIHQQRQSALRVTDSGETVSIGDGQAHTVALPSSQYVRGDESDAFLSDGEEEALRERHESLQKALTVVLDDLSEEYTHLANLSTLFEEWHGSYSKEYTQCFASLIFADMAGILIQVELCAMNDPWDESRGYKEARWTTAVHLAIQTGTLDQTAVERLVQKWIFPTILDLLAKSGISYISSHQSRSVTQFILRLQKLVPVESPVWSKLLQPFIVSVSQSLADIAIPILTIAPDPNQPLGLDDVDEALFAATWGQLHRIKKTISNLLLYWAPILQFDMEFCDLVLHFIANKFVLLLSSLHDKIEGGPAETPADVFRTVYQGLEQTGWLEYPEFVLQTTLIRGAASAFYVESG